MRSFYTSRLIKILNIPQFSRVPLTPAPPPPQVVESRKNCYQINLCRSLTRLSIFIVLARPKAPNSPKHRKSPQSSPQRERITSSYNNHVSRTLLILPTKFHPDFSTLSVFQNFRFPPSTPPSVTGSGLDLKREL